MRAFRPAAWMLLLVTVVAVLLAPAMARNAGNQALPALSADSRSFAPPQRVEGELPLPVHEEEAPAKKPRVTALGVQSRHGNARDDDAGHLVLVAHSSATSRSPSDGRMTRIHAQAVTHLPDPSQRLHPAQAPPAR